MSGIKDTPEWPEKKDIYNYENREWNDCLAAIEPIKEMEVELNREVIGDLITDLQLALSMEEKWKIANHLAANLGKFLLIGRGDNV